MRRRAAVGVAVVLAGLWGPVPGRAPAQDKGPGPLPEALVAAWGKAGGRPGWMAGDGGFRAGGAGRAGEWPAYRFRAWQAGVLAKLPSPEQPFGLDLSETEVTDAGLEELAIFKQMRALSLRSTRAVSDAGLKELATLKQLRTLYLSRTEVTDAGLKHLALLKQLRALDLSHTRITDAGLKELAKVQQLQTLYLGGTGVTDAERQELKRLEKLGIYSPRVTDAGLKELAALKQLRTLSLLETGVTGAGVAALRKALPGCQITH